MIYNEKRVEMLRQRYPEGTRICLDGMDNDPRPIPPGTKGIVQFVDDAGTLHCKFNNGRTLGVIPDVISSIKSLRNRVRLISKQRKILSARKLQKRKILKKTKK